MYLNKTAYRRGISSPGSSDFKNEKKRPFLHPRNKSCHLKHPNHVCTLVIQNIFFAHKVNANKVKLVGLIFPQLMNSVKFRLSWCKAGQKRCQK